MKRGALVVVAVVAVVPRLALGEVAAAEPAPDPAAVEAGEANLESNAPRDGLVFTFAVGGAVTLGFGVNDSTGTGGAATIRLAHVAARRALVVLELVGSALFHQVREGTGADAMTSTFTNQLTTFLVGFQGYANAALWLRIAGGAGRYLGDEVLIDRGGGQPQIRGDVRLAGPAVSVGVGLDVLRFKRVRISAELQATGLVNREGLLTSSGLLFGLSID
jgi:hypothetical protein